MTLSAQHLLSKLATEGATGEFICTNEGAEVHVHLQRGRIAWATSTGQPHVFTEYLFDRCEIDVQRFRDLVEDCRRTGKPLNRTLVDHGVAGERMIRDAVGHQVRFALTTLGAGDATFVPRKRYNAYDLAFTLDYAELSGDSAEPPLSECAAAIPGLAWIEHWRDAEPRAHIGVAPSPAAPLAKCAYASESHLVILRSERMTVIGAALEREGDWVWCGVRGDTLLGSALLAMKSTLSLASPKGASETGARATHDAVVTKDALSPLAASVFALTPEVQALLLARTGRDIDIVARRPEVDETAVLASCGAAKEMLEIFKQGSRGDVVSISTASGSSQLFGELDATTGAPTSDPAAGCAPSHWLLLDAHAHPGIGWAKLQAWRSDAG